MAEQPKIHGIIPARWGSTRFPGKSLHLICGKPLIQWVVEAAARAATLDEIVVATDDERIAMAVKNLDCKVVMTDPELPSGTDRVAAAADVADRDIVINLQGDEPLIPGELIDSMAERMIADSGLEMATAAVPIRSLEELYSSNVVKVVTNARDIAMYFSRSPIPAKRDGEVELDSGIYWRHLGIYAYRGGFLKRLVASEPCALERCEMLEQLRALHLGAQIALIKTDPVGIGVDTPEDAKNLEREFKRLGMCRDPARTLWNRKV